MFGTDAESAEDKGISEEDETETGETGTEVLRILVSSTEDTTEDGSGREVTEPRTDAKEGSETDKGTGEGTIRSRKVTLCRTQSINGLCRVNQSSPSTAGKSRSNLVNKNRICRSVPQGNLTEILEA